MHRGDLLPQSSPKRHNRPHPRLRIHSVSVYSGNHEPRNTLTVMAVATIPQPLNHPLPPKPVQAQGPPAERGVKRARSPDMYPDPRRRRRQVRWPTVEPNYTVGLKGEGDLGIQKITFSSLGTHFALTCKHISCQTLFSFC